MPCEQEAVAYGRALAGPQNGWAPAFRELSLASQGSASVDPQARRWLSVAVATVALVACTPIMLMIALLVKLTSRGPVFYAQTRVGVDRRLRDGGNQRRTLDLGGKPFRIYKFRTMGDGPRGGVAPDDLRVTPIGRFLRSWRLDGLPQLWNVLRGDMNIVGPRPEQPQIFMNLREQVDRYEHRQRVLPGITGWAQIHRLYRCDLQDVQRELHYDLEYIARQSAREDLRIMMRTIPVLLFGKGAWSWNAR